MKLIAYLIKYIPFVFLMWFVIKKVDTTHNILNQSVWVYIFVYLPIILGYDTMFVILFDSISKRLKKNDTSNNPGPGNA